LERQLAGLQQAAGVSRDQARAGAEAADATRKQQEEAQKLLDIYNQIGTSLTTGVLDGITAAVEGTKSLGESASQVLKDIAKQLLRSGIMQLLTSLAGNDGVGFFSFLTGTLGKRAMGGPVSAGSSYMVGERGPELFTPKHGGSIVPNNALGGGTTNVVVNVDASGSSVQGDQTQGKQLGLAVSAAVQAELIKQQRPGGLLASTRR
jgi:phage-related minor tail protein